MDLIPGAVTSLLLNAPALWFFIDYDGTLAEFAPTPDTIEPDPALIDLISRLAASPKIKIAIVSGRALNNALALLPVPGITIAGTYGIEIRLPDGAIIHPAEFAEIRPELIRIKPVLEQLLAGRKGFYLEDKGLALAIHAKFADEAEAVEILHRARQVALEVLLPDRFRILGGFRFLEIGPHNADKGKTVADLLERFPLPGVVPIYLGDDDKDEAGFQVVREQGGVTIVVSPVDRPSHAEYRLESPAAVRAWLENFTPSGGRERT